MTHPVPPLRQPLNTLTPEHLLAHLDNGTLWPPLSDTQEPQDLRLAYRQAQGMDRLRQQRGAQPRGYKIGFTNTDMWARYGVTSPIWGRIWNTTIIDGSSAGPAIVNIQSLCQPRIEPEVVFGLRTTPNSTEPQALYEALDWIAPGFEIVQSHRPEWSFTATQAIVDGGLHGRLIVGPRHPVADLAKDAATLQGLLTALRVTLSRDGTPVEQGSGSKVLGNPLLALGHLVHSLSEDEQADKLTVGDIVTTGTLTDAWPIEAGQTWLAHYPGLWPDLNVSFRTGHS